MQKENRPPMDTFFAESTTGLALDLFEHMSDVYFFVKDRQCRFIKVNENFLRLFGYQNSCEIIGLTDFDMVTRDLALKYQCTDLNVLETGEPLINYPESVSSAEDITSLHITTKLPIFNQQGSIIGLAGTTRDTLKAYHTIQPFSELQAAIEKIENYYAERLTIEDIAASVNMTESTFLRHFKKHFKISPLKYLNQVRFNAASELLIKTDLPISEIAHKTGFCDQSHLARGMRSTCNLTPTLYRQKFRAFNQN